MKHNLRSVIMLFVLISILVFLVGFRLGRKVDEFDKNYVPPTAIPSPTEEPEPTADPLPVEPDPTTQPTAEPTIEPTVQVIEVTVTPVLRLDEPIPAE